MLKKNLHLILFHLLIITLSNFLVQYPMVFFSYTTTWGMFSFPFLVLASDLTVRLRGKKVARYIIYISYIPCLIISMALNSYRVAIASASAYFVGQILDIFIFSSIRKKNKSWWTAPVISTTTSNVLDTYLFFAVAFYQCSDPFMKKNWLQIAHVDLIFKIFISIIFFLPIYAFVLNYILKKYSSDYS